MNNRQQGWGKRCDRCGKGFQNIMNLSHSHIRTNRKSMPNLHKTTLTIGGVTRQFRFCTKCLRIMKDTFGQVYKDAQKIVADTQAPIAVQIQTETVKTEEDLVKDETQTVQTAEEVVEEADEPKTKTKKKAKSPKVKKESSRKKSITDLIEEEE